MNKQIAVSGVVVVVGLVLAAVGASTQTFPLLLVATVLIAGGSYFLYRFWSSLGWE